MPPPVHPLDWYADGEPTPDEAHHHRHEEPPPSPPSPIAMHAEPAGGGHHRRQSSSSSSSSSRRADAPPSDTSGVESALLGMLPRLRPVPYRPAPPPTAAAAAAADELPPPLPDEPTSRCATPTFLMDAPRILVTTATVVVEPPATELPEPTPIFQPQPIAVVAVPRPVVAASAFIPTPPKAPSSSPDRKLEETPLPSDLLPSEQEWIDDGELDLTLAHYVDSDDEQPHQRHPLDHTYVQPEHDAHASELDFSTHVVAGSPEPSPYIGRTMPPHRPAHAQLPSISHEHNERAFPAQPQQRFAPPSRHSTASGPISGPPQEYPPRQHQPVQQPYFDDTPLGPMLPPYTAAPPPPSFASSVEEAALRDEEQRFAHYQIQRQLLRQVITPPSQMRAALRGNQEQPPIQPYAPQHQQQPPQPQHVRHPSLNGGQPPVAYSQSLHSAYPSLRQPLPAAQSARHEQPPQQHSPPRDYDDDYQQSRSNHGPRQQQHAYPQYQQQHDAPPRRTEPLPPPNHADSFSPESPHPRRISSSPPSQSRPVAPPSPPLPAQARRAAREHPSSVAMPPASTPVVHSHSPSPRNSVSSPPADVQALRATIDRLVADAARLTAREAALTKELVAKDRALDAEQEKHEAIHAKLMVSEDRVHELTAELNSVRSAHQNAELRAASGLEQLTKQKKAIQEAAAQQQMEQERQIRGSRIIQQLSKRLAALTNSTPEHVLDTLNDTPLSSSRRAVSPPRMQDAPAPPEPTYARRGGSHNGSQVVFQDPIDTRPPVARRPSGTRPPVDVTTLRPAGFIAPAVPASPHRAPERDSPHNARDPLQSQLRFEDPPPPTRQYHLRNPQQPPFSENFSFEPHAHPADRDAHRRPPPPPQRNNQQERFDDRHSPPHELQSTPRERNNPHRPPQQDRDFQPTQRVRSYPPPEEEWSHSEPPLRDAADDEDEDLDQLIARELEQRHRLEQELQRQPPPERKRDERRGPPPPQQYERRNDHSYSREPEGRPAADFLPDSMSPSRDRGAGSSSHRVAHSPRRGPSPPRGSRSQRSPPRRASPDRPSTRSPPRRAPPSEMYSPPQRVRSPPSHHDDNRPHASVRSAAASSDPAMRGLPPSQIHVPVAAHAPFATSVRSGLEATVADEVDQLEHELSHLLSQKEKLEVALVRAARPGASFDPSVLPSSSVATQSATGGARSRHAMMREGEAALLELDKNIHAHKHSIRKMQARAIGR